MNARMSIEDKDMCDESKEFNKTPISPTPPIPHKISLLFPFHFDLYTPHHANLPVWPATSNTPLPSQSSTCTFRSQHDIFDAQDANCKTHSMSNTTQNESLASKPHPPTPITISTWKDPVPKSAPTSHHHTPDKPSPSSPQHWPDTRTAPLSFRPFWDQDTPARS